MRRKVKYAKLHGTEAFVPGVGGLGSTLPPSMKTLNLKMWREPGGDLELEINGHYCAIPAANLQLIEYEEEKPVVLKAAK